MFQGNRGRVSLWRQEAHFLGMCRFLFLSEASWETVTFAFIYFIFYVMAFFFLNFFLIPIHLSKKFSKLQLVSFCILVFVIKFENPISRVEMFHFNLVSVLV